MDKSVKLADQGHSRRSEPKFQGLYENTQTLRSCTVLSKSHFLSPNPRAALVQTVKMGDHAVKKDATLTV